MACPGCQSYGTIATGLLGHAKLLRSQSRTGEVLLEESLDREISGLVSISCRYFAQMKDVLDCDSSYKDPGVNLWGFEVGPPPHPPSKSAAIGAILAPHVEDVAAFLPSFLAHSRGQDS